MNESSSSENPNTRKVIKKMTNLGIEYLKMWVSALRSGLFRQGTGALKNQDCNGETTFCCLGVLREVFLDDKVIASGYSAVEETRSNIIYRELGEFLGRQQVGILVAMNDSGESFERIADEIETMFPEIKKTQGVEDGKDNN